MGLSWVIRILILLTPFIYFFTYRVPIQPDERPFIGEDWIDHTLDREFKAFEQTGITREMLETTWKEGHIIRENLKRYQIINSRVYGEESYLKYLLEAMVQNYPVPDVDFLYYAGDRLQPSFFKRGRFSHCAPIFVSARNRSQQRAIVFCDSFYDIRDEQDGWKGMVRAVEEHQIPWEEREEKLFWRGAPNDGRYKIDRWKEFPRGRLVYESRFLHPALIDAAFHQFPVRSDTSPEQFEEALGPISYVPIANQLRYKYQIIVDGVTIPFTGSYWKFLSGSLVFKQDSEDLMFFHGALVPWEHYIPVKNNLSDLSEKIQWAREHDAEAKEIATNGRLFAQTHLMPEHLLFYSYKALVKYASLQRFKPCHDF